MISHGNNAGKLQGARICACNGLMVQIKKVMELLFFLLLCGRLRLFLIGRKRMKIKGVEKEFILPI